VLLKLTLLALHLQVLSQPPP